MSISFSYRDRAFLHSEEVAFLILDLQFVHQPAEHFGTEAATPQPPALGFENSTTPVSVTTWFFTVVLLRHRCKLSAIGAASRFKLDALVRIRMMARASCLGGPRGPPQSGPTQLVRQRWISQWLSACACRRRAISRGLCAPAKHSGGDHREQRRPNSESLHLLRPFSRTVTGADLRPTECMNGIVVRWRHRRESCT